MANKRIVNLTEQADLANGSYVMIDDESVGSKKYKLKKIMDAVGTKLDGPVDTTLAVSGKAADAKKVGDEITNLKSDFDQISTLGINLFDKTTVKANTYITRLGGEAPNSSGIYCSDYIAVIPNTDYDTIGIGSASAYLTCAFYDSTKTYISASFYGSRAKYTLTTPSNCYYVRLNMVSATVDSQFFVQTNENPDAYSPYGKIVDGVSSIKVSLISENAIRYNSTTGVLYSASNILLLTQEKWITLGTQLNVGFGSFLYWNKGTGEVYASNDHLASNDIYLIAILKLQTYDYNALVKNTGILSNFPILEFDMVNNVLHIRTNSYTATLIDAHSIYTIPAHYEQDITFTSDRMYVYYDPSTAVFGATTAINTIYNNSYVYIATKGMTYVESNSPYITITNDKRLSKKAIMTWGDSLTWYDGHEFTWGDHEGETCIGYQSYLKKYLGGVVHNYGASGYTTPQICGLITSSSLDFTQFDYMVIMSGDNDDRLAVSLGTVLPVGSTYDTSTVCGALQSAIEIALTRNPSLRIIIMSEPMGWTYVNGEMKRVTSLIPNALRQVAEQYGLPFIDLFAESGINELNRNTFYADPAPENNHLYMYHPNNDGWKRISKVICNKLADF